jgi:hypothetical protein
VRPDWIEYFLSRRKEPIILKRGRSRLRERAWSIGCCAALLDGRTKITVGASGAHEGREADHCEEERCATCMAWRTWVELSVESQE